jgi:hypothetical protein
VDLGAKAEELMPMENDFWEFVPEDVNENGLYEYMFLE